MSEPCSDYPVGYGKPPQHGRFQKGRSGNPRGRPKRTESFAQLARRTLNERIVIKENGERRSITKQQAALKQLVNRAAAGDLRAFRELLKLQSMIALQEEREPILVQIVRFGDRDTDLGDK
jgi:hypothetical protein